MQKFEYTINDELGIHARPAGLLVKAAGKFKCEVSMTKDGKKADVKKIFSLMGLGVKCGNTIEVVTDGEDEEAAMAEIKEMLETNL